MCISVYQASIIWSSQSEWMCVPYQCFQSARMRVPYQCFQSVWMCVPYQCLTRTGACGLSVPVEKGMKIVFTSWGQLSVHVWNQFNACNKCLKSKLWRSCNSMFTAPHCTFTYSWVVTCCTICSVTNESCEMFAASPLNWISYLFLLITLESSSWKCIGVSAMLETEVHNQGVIDTISLDLVYILVAFVTRFLSLLYSAAGIWDIICLQKETFSIRKLVGCRRYLFFVVVFSPSSLYLKWCFATF